MNQSKIWILDDDPSFCTYMEKLIKKNIYSETKSFTKSQDFIDKIFHEKDAYPDLILMDIRLEDENGLRLAKRIHHNLGPIPIIHLTALSGEEILDGDVMILSKPVNTAHLLKAIERAFAMAQAS